MDADDADRRRPLAAAVQQQLPRRAGSTCRCRARITRIPNRDLTRLRARGRPLRDRRPARSPTACSPPASTIRSRPRFYERLRDAEPRSYYVAEGPGPERALGRGLQSSSRRTRAPLRTSPRGTVFSSAVASSSETSTIASPCSAAIRPKLPSCDEVGRLQPVARREHAVARRSASRRAGRGRARSRASRSRCAARSRARAASPTPRSRAARARTGRRLARPRRSPTRTELVALADDDDREVLAALVAAAGSPRRRPRP